MPARKDDLSRLDAPSQATKTGLVIPVPMRSEFFGGLEKAAQTPKRKPSRRRAPRKP